MLSISSNVTVVEVNSAKIITIFFDVIVAADCMYMPWLHTELLDSIDLLLSDRGVALMPFALHGNTEMGMF